MSDFLSCNTLADTGGCPNISMRAEVEAMRQSLIDQYGEAQIEYEEAVRVAEEQLVYLKDDANAKLGQAETSPSPSPSPSRSRSPNPNPSPSPNPKPKPNQAHAPSRRAYLEQASSLRP